MKTIFKQDKLLHQEPTKIIMHGAADVVELLFASN